MLPAYHYRRRGDGRDARGPIENSVPSSPYTRQLQRFVDYMNVEIPATDTDIMPRGGPDASWLDRRLVLRHVTELPSVGGLPFDELIDDVAPAIPLHIDRAT